MWRNLCMCCQKHENDAQNSFLVEALNYEQARCLLILRWINIYYVWMIGDSITIENNELQLYTLIWIYPKILYWVKLSHVRIYLVWFNFYKTKELMWTILVA